MEKKTKLTAFCSPKGGIGKSTYTILAASYLHYIKGLSVMIVDADYSQPSAFKQRLREEKVVNETEYYRNLMTEQYRRTGQKIYPVIKAEAKYALEEYETYRHSDDRHLDVAFFDLPGTMNSPGVMETITSLDHVFVPIAADPLVMDSTLSLMSVLDESVFGRPDVRLSGAHMFWTKVDKRERNIYYDQYDELIDSYGLSRLAAHIPERVHFKREIYPFEAPVYRSTLFAPCDSFIADSCIGALMEEICSVLNLG